MVLSTQHALRKQETASDRTPPVCVEAIFLELYAGKSEQDACPRCCERKSGLAFLVAYRHLTTLFRECARRAMTEVQIQTKDGTCRSFFFKPAGDGPWPAILVYMDGPGIRPAIKELAERLSGYGYAVLLPDLFYRAGPYDPVDPKVVFGNPQLREAHRERFMNPTTPERVMADTEAFLAFLANRPEVKKGPIGVTGKATIHTSNRITNRKNNARIRLLHGRTDGADRRGHFPGPDRGRGLVPPGTPRHGPALESAPPRAQDQGQGVRGGRDRGRQLHGRHEGAPEEGPGRGWRRPHSRNVSGQARVGASRYARVQPRGGRAPLARARGADGRRPQAMSDVDPPIYVALATFGM